ncbi:hypothetical protein DFH09DRAFT_1095440 [Mycena vulgaris]|nr:hypothetical protein DFH09DRAFT_1095440 [Mycena vulgaris]
MTRTIPCASSTLIITNSCSATEPFPPRCGNGINFQKNHLKQSSKNRSRRDGGTPPPPPKKLSPNRSRRAAGTELISNGRRAAPTWRRRSEQATGLRRSGLSRFPPPRSGGVTCHSDTPFPPIPPSSLRAHPARSATVLAATRGAPCPASVLRVGNEPQPSAPPFPPASAHIAADATLCDTERERRLGCLLSTQMGLGNVLENLGLFNSVARGTKYQGTLIFTLFMHISSHTMAMGRRLHFKVLNDPPECHLPRRHRPPRTRQLPTGESYFTESLLCDSAAHTGPRRSPNVHTPRPNSAPRAHDADALASVSLPSVSDMRALGRNMAPSPRFCRPAIPQRLRIPAAITASVGRGLLYYRPVAQTYVACPVTPAALHPAPPVPPPFLQPAFYVDDDDDVLTFAAFAESADTCFSFQMQSSDELHVQPRFSLAETETDDGEYAERERGQAREWDREEVMPLFVVPWEPARAGMPA